MRSVVEIGAGVPAFLGKLWKLVNDTETNHLISWSPGGKTFVIKNQADFARELLPLYYKHNNMASFIRQLNMYGFHKITSVENGGLRYEKDEIEFSHPCFMKGHAYLLEHIKRKIANPKSIVASSEGGDKVLLKPELMNKMLTDVKQMKGKQESLDAKFSAMKQENEALWREVAILRQKHVKQQNIVNNLIQFLMSVVAQPSRPSGPGNTPAGVKRPFQLMINSEAHNTNGENSYPGRIKNMKLDKHASLDDSNEDNQEDGPTIHELAQDDILHNDGTQDSIPSGDFTIEVPIINMASSPTEPSTSTYHVTMEDGDDAETGAQRVMYPVSRRYDTRRSSDSLPIITSASPTPPTPTGPIEQPILEQMFPKAVNKSKGLINGNKNVTRPGKSLEKNTYNVLNPTADLKLPAEIFASDDSVSDIGIAGTEDFNMQNTLQDFVQESLLSNLKDKMISGVNIKLEKTDSDNCNKKYKKSQKNAQPHLNLADIKTELQDDFDWNDMTLATVNNNTNVNRFQSRIRRDNNSKNREDYAPLYGTNPNKNDIDDHLDAMQTDLESLRELLRNDPYAFDTNTLLGTADSRLLPSMSLAIPTCQHTTNNYLFGSEDPFYGLSYNTMDENAKTPNNVEGNQLISYTGNIPDFEDISIPDLGYDNSQDACESPAPSSSVLNTPQMQIRSPSFTIRP